MPGNICPMFFAAVLPQLAQELNVGDIVKHPTVQCLENDCGYWNKIFQACGQSRPEAKTQTPSGAMVQDIFENPVADFFEVADKPVADGAFYRRNLGGDSRSVRQSGGTTFDLDLEQDRLDNFEIPVIAEIEETDPSQFYADFSAEPVGVQLTPEQLVQVHAGLDQDPDEGVEIPEIDCSEDFDLV